MSDPQIKTVLVQPTVGTIRVVDGQRVEDVSSPLISVPPDGAPRASDERLFVVIHLAGQALPHVFLGLREVLIQTYWSSPGSVTAALRMAVAAANRRLYHANLRSGPAARSYGSVACVVMSGEDLFILQAGAVCVCISHAGHFETLSVDERVPALGIGPVADIRLSHTSISAGDVLLMSSPPLATAWSGSTTSIMPETRWTPSIALSTPATDRRWASSLRCPRTATWATTWPRWLAG